MSLEERLQALAELVTASRATQWSLGDELADLVRDFGREALGKAAEVCSCTRARLLQLIRVAVAIPPEHRYPDVPWSVAREAVHRAHALGREPLELYLEAVERGWSVGDIRRLGREEESRELCPTCGRPMPRRRGETA